MSSVPQVITEIKRVLEPLGYKKKRNAFYCQINGVWRVIDIQTGSHGGGYFFVNLGVHPFGLPQLVTGKLFIPNYPKISECIVWQRIERACPEEPFLRFQEELVSYEDSKFATRLASALPLKALPWLDAWSQSSKLSSVAFDDIAPILSVVPVLKEKAATMLQTFVKAKVGDYNGAEIALRAYLNAPSGGHVFSEVDSYMIAQVRK